MAARPWLTGGGKRTPRAEGVSRPAVPGHGTPAMAGEPDRWKRQAANERLLREWNRETARIAVGGSSPAPEGEEILFLCACGRERCEEQIWLPVAEYRAAHRRPHRFIVTPGHVTPRIERVVERHPSYTVVEKLPAYQAPDTGPVTANELRLARAEQNELAIQAYNQRRIRIEEEGGAAEDEPIPFACECDDAVCGRAVEMRIAEYRRATGPPDRFVVVPGHEDPGVEVLVETHDDYVVVSKPYVHRS